MVLYILSLIGVAVFGISGALAAGRKQYDWVGVTVVAFVTALGGGTLRDVLLDTGPVFWMKDTAYIWVILASCFFTILLVKITPVPYRGLLIADALGLALFSISGARIAEQVVSSSVVVILMGVITGVAGGVMRDLLTVETPVLFRAKETLYSIAAVFGISTYLLCKSIDFEEQLASLVGIGVITIVRFAAIFWNIHLPAFKLPGTDT